MITVTASALQQMRRILRNKKYIRFGAKSGGCNGFEYLMEATDSISDLDQLVDVGVPVAVCGRSGFLVVGTTINWREDVMGQRFEFVNPTASGTCGCGATFSFTRV